MSRFPSLLPLLLLFSSTSSTRNSPPLSSRCDEWCGRLRLPFPFHLDPSCGAAADSTEAFRLSCLRNSTLFLRLGSTDLRILRFDDGGTLLADFPPPPSSSSSYPPSSACDRHYFHVADGGAPFSLGGNEFFGVSAANVLRLYDCEDSSVCRTACLAGGCEGGGGSAGCCYPLSDGSVWRPGDGFAVFSSFGCRGFSSWVVRGKDGGSRLQEVQSGMEIEWAVPNWFRNGSACADGAVVVNSTAVRGGLRCACAAGFWGDGFAGGVGCLKSCARDGKQTYGSECDNISTPSKTKAGVLTGIVVTIFFSAAALLFAFARWRLRASRWDVERSSCLSNTVGIGRTTMTRLFTYQELSKAVRGFERSRKKKLGDGRFDETIHFGELEDGTSVAVQQLTCESEQDLVRAVDRVGILAQISHANVARVVGCCVRSNRALLLVHEFQPGGNLEELLKQGKRHNLDWPRRIGIATQVANAVAHLQLHLRRCPAIPTPRDIKSSDVLVASDSSSAKVSVSRLVNMTLSDSSRSDHITECARDFGCLLLELVVGLKHEDLPKLVLQKIIAGEFEDIVDPFLGFQDMRPSHREQIRRVARLAGKCLVCGRGDGAVRMADVAEELTRIVEPDTGGGHASAVGGPSSLEVTFSNSSLLQMVSVSPEAKQVP